MDTFQSLFTALLLTLIFGFWLSAKGKPYHGILFNVHKLAALAAVLLVSSKIYDGVKGSEIQYTLMILLTVTGLCVAALFVSGAFMSAGKFDYVTTKKIHNAALMLGLPAAMLTIYQIFLAV